MSDTNILRRDFYGNPPAISGFENGSGNLPNLTLCEFSNEERLAYCRAHGLVDCADYPGGDAAFESDVLSGAFHDGHDAAAFAGLPKREDEYVIRKVLDRTFRYDGSFDRYFFHRDVLLAFYAMMQANGLYQTGLPWYERTAELRAWSSAKFREWERLGWKRG